MWSPSLTSTMLMEAFQTVQDATGVTCPPQSNTKGQNLLETVVQVSSHSNSTNWVSTRPNRGQRGDDSLTPLRHTTQQTIWKASGSISPGDASLHLAKYCARRMKCMYYYLLLLQYAREEMHRYNNFFFFQFWTHSIHQCQRAWKDSPTWDKLPPRARIKVRMGHRPTTDI